MSAHNGKPEADPVINNFTYFTADGAEDQWIAFSTTKNGLLSKSLTVVADELTLLSYGLEKVARNIYDKIR